MDAVTRERLFGYYTAFDQPGVLLMVWSVAVLLVVVAALILTLDRLGKLGPDLRRELGQKYVAGLVMIPLIAVPVLLGAAWLVAAVLVASLLCFKEFARSIGLFREHAMCLMVVLGILGVTFTVVDHWYGLFVAMTPFTITTMAAVALLRDRPRGYIQRLALGILGFVLFGACLGHLGYMGNDARYRSIVLLLLLSVQMNDVFAFVTDRVVGGPKIAPKTIPRKTIAGSAVAVALTTLLVVYVGETVFRGEMFSGIGHRIVLGVMISLTGQFGELAISAVKCDIGIVEKRSFFPGRGGFLDRASGLLFSAPAVFHYINYFRGIGLDQPSQILSRLI